MYKSGWVVSIHIDVFVSDFGTDVDEKHHWSPLKKYIILAGINKLTRQYVDI